MSTTVSTRYLAEENDLAARLAEPADAAAVVEMFCGALGNEGIQAPGHEPYPDPSLFTQQGVLDNIEDSNRNLIIVEDGNAVVGGIIVDKVNDVIVENNCMAVDRRFRHRAAGSLLVEAVDRFLSQSNFILNITELVTHSLASQCAHIRRGYDAFLGFGYAQYPRVFFADHPESVLWSFKLCGKLALCTELSTERVLYVPEAYAQLAWKLARQLPINYTIEPVGVPATQLPQMRGGAGEMAAGAASGAASADSLPDQVVCDWKEGYEHAYFIVQPGFDVPACLHQIDDALARARSLNKRFLLVRIPANNRSCALLAEQLRRRGFVFNSILPGYHLKGESGDDRLHDVLSLQWVAPHIMASNPLPGDSGSVIQLFGYPDNITGDIVGMIRRELSELPCV